MKSIVPYTKEIEFTTKIAEICSISLEHELNTTGEIEGNFIVSGEYKTHEVSVNKEPFSYKLPFSLEITEEIEKDSIDFEITDFTYEILKDSILKVNIEFCVTADEKEIEDEKEDNEDEFVREEVDEEKESIRESVIEEINTMFEEKEEPEEVEERLDAESETVILNSIEEKESEFASYHIHIVKSEDSIESICTTYNTDINTLKEYNNVDSITVGDKLILPCLDE